MTELLVAIKHELHRLGASGGYGIEVEPGPYPGTVTFYDTQETAIHAGQAALDALRAASADGWDGGGFEAAWQALSLLPEHPIPEMS